METACPMPRALQMPILLINLDRSPERLQRMEALLHASDLAFTRIPAVDGKLLSVDERQRWVTKQGRYYQMAAGEVACFLSHRKCWEIAATGSASHVVIFEDDIRLGRSAGEILSRTDWIPPDADIIKIETFLHRTHIDKKSSSAILGRSISRLWRNHYGTGGYIISRNGAAKLLSISEKFPCPVDEFIFNPRFPGFSSLIIYQMTPALCIQEQRLDLDDRDSALDSTITTERRIIQKSHEKTRIKKFFRSIIKPFENLLRFSRYFIKGRKIITIDYL